MVIGKRAYSLKTCIIRNVPLYFIDDYGTACAVGYLIIHSEYKDLSYQIARENNYAYVKDLLVYDDLIAWASEAGFTADELAWIQPGYWEPAPYKWDPVGQGTNGAINASEGG